MGAKSTKYVSKETAIATIVSGLSVIPMQKLESVLEAINDETHALGRLHNFIIEDEAVAANASPVKGFRYTVTLEGGSRDRALWNGRQWIFDTRCDRAVVSWRI